MDSDGINKSLNTLSINEKSPSSQSIISIDDVSSEPGVKSSSPKPQNTEKKIQSNRPPPHNVPEKIIFCLDSVTDSNKPTFKISDFNYSSLSMFKRVIEIFVSNKNQMDARHEFALLTFDKRSVRWTQELSNIPSDIIKSLDSVVESDLQESEFDLGCLLEQVWQTIKVPKQDKDVNVSPPYIVRLILLYSRNCVPILEKDYKELLLNPYFVMDVILSHEDKPDDNKQQEIFDSLCIDEKEYSYNFAVGTNASTLHESMAKLLAHPLQRPLQDQAMYQFPVFD